MKDDSGFFTFRQSYLRGERFKTPKRELNRYLYLGKNGETDYQFGPAVSLEQVGAFISNDSGLEYPVNGILHTPLGDIWMAPKGDSAHELVLITGDGPKSIYESPYEFHKGGFDGPDFHEGYIPNTMFTSLTDQPEMAYIQPGW